METRNAYTRKEALQIGVAAVAASSLYPLPVSAQTQGQPSSPSKTVDGNAWEDVLLLQALLYLGLSSAQVKRVIEIAQTTHQRLTQPGDSDEKLRGDLNRLLRQQRQALLAGQSLGMQEQQEIAALGVLIRQSQLRREQDVLAFAIPPVTRLLTPKQKQRVFLLVHGWNFDGDQMVPSLLREPTAGFVQDTRLQMLLARQEEAQSTLKAAQDEPISGNLSEQDIAGLKAKNADLERNFEQAQQALTQAQRDLRQQLEEATTEAIEQAIRFFVQRVFLSARLLPVLQERFPNTKPAQPTP